MKPSGGWRYSEATLQELVKKDGINFGKDETVIPRIKRYLHDYPMQVPKSTLFFDSQATTKWLKRENIAFDFPKSIDYIKHILSYTQDNSATVFDFFVGFRVIIMTQANSQVNIRVLELLPKFKIKKMNRWCAV